VTDWPLIAVRFALYADLGLAFGWPLFCLYALWGEVRRREGHLPAALPLVLFGLTGLLLSALGFGLMLAAMSGTGLGELDWELARTVIGDSAVGKAFLVRLAALALVALAGCWSLRAPLAGLCLAAVCGAVALASLAFNGHAGATEGQLGIVHLLSDFLHLLAAGLWLGALAALLALVARHRGDRARLDITYRALHGFSRVGTAAVLVLVLTGIINAALIIRPFDPRVVSTAYGQLLLVKLALFGLMLTLAAANRFRLTPSLGTALDAPAAPERPAARLRLSIALETGAAVAILALVGWLGTLDPSAIQ
jgi:putative copper resistance protein D